MKWKIFLTAFISTLFCAMPENMIGCSDSGDPWDYYTSFFSRDIIPQRDLQPFYYTALVTFYTDEPDEEKRAAFNNRIVEEWRRYCKNQPSPDEVSSFIYTTNIQDINRMSGQNANAALLKNGMAKYLVATKDLTALTYISLTRESEGFSALDYWEAQPKKDSIAINKLIDRTQAALKETKSEFLKNKFAFLRCKLAFYNRRFTDCIRWYTESFTESSNAVVQEPAYSYMAGSLYRSGRKKEAAYHFSKLFAASSLNKHDIFLGFLWSTDNCDPERESDYLSLCKNDKERANMLALFGMYGTQYRLSTLRKVYGLDPDSRLIPLLVTREISKLEEKYLTPVLSAEKGGKQYYYSWNEAEHLNEDRKQLGLMVKFLESAAQNPSVNNRGLFFTGAAYLSFINKDYSAAKRFMEEAKKLSLTERLKDQLQLLNLLIAVNEPAKLDAPLEKNILPSLQWLQKKAGKDEEYKIFMRNLMSEIIGQRYEQQGEKYRAALAYGVADRNGGWWDGGLEFAQNKLSTPDLLKLYNVFTDKNTSEYEKFIVANSSLTRNQVINTIGTSFMRDFNFPKAIEWLKRSTERDTLSYSDYDYDNKKTVSFYIDPFYDYVNDAQRYQKKSSVAYTKLSLAEKLLEIQNNIPKTTDREAKAKLCYKLASALYNMSFYGNSWEMVDYYRHTTEWNKGVYDAPWEKEYYGVQTARSYYQKAYELTANKEFKAACYFLIVKCAQRQLIAPDDYSYYSIDQASDSEPEMQAFWKKFKYNPLFGNFSKDFGDTKYYKYVYDRCSYLRDFVNKRK
jgi:hypothetical protein